MECDELTEKTVGRLAGQLSMQEARDLAEHLARCASCSAESGRIETAWARLGDDPDAEPSVEFRRRGRLLVEEEMIRRRVREFRPRPRALRVAAQAAAILVAGGLGFAAASRWGDSARRSTSPAGSAAGPGVSDLQNGPRLSNVSYQALGSDGRIGIGFDVTTRRTVEGLPTDPAVSSVLAYVMSHNSESAGEKSRAIELVSEHYSGDAAPSPDIVSALTTTLRKDPNPGVRKKAAEALAGMKMTAEIRSALLDALRGDRNPAVRLVAIDRLAATAKEAPDPRTIQSLRERAIDPSENGFVRAKAASALKTIEF